MAIHSIVVLALIAELIQSFCYLDKRFTRSHSMELQFSGFYAVYMLSLLVVTGTEDIMLRGPGRKSTLLVSKLPK